MVDAGYQPQRIDIKDNTTVTLPAINTQEDEGCLCKSTQGEGLLPPSELCCISSLDKSQKSLRINGIDFIALLQHNPDRDSEVVDFVVWMTDEL